MAVIGLGSRGCSIFERIVTLAELAAKKAAEDPGGSPPKTLRVEIVDPSAEGEGFHSTSQPDYLLLNTLCGEISMFPGPEAVGTARGDAGPSLYEWFTAREMRLAEDGRTVGREGRPIRPDDFLPRRLLGEYLRWFFARTLARVPEHLRVSLHRTSAVRLDSDPASGVVVELADGARLSTDFAFLTVGHVRNAPPAGAPRTVSTPYPLPETLDGIAPEETVAVGGFGLAAMDVLAALTIGRGGHFDRTGGQPRYRPSGAEPAVLLHSRSGVPFRARPARARLDSPFQPLVLTRPAVAELRRGGPLDFERTLFPLVLAEMRIAHHRCRTLVEAGAEAEAELAAELAEAVAADRLPGTLDLLDRLHGRFDPLTVWDTSDRMAREDSAGYQRWIVDTLRRDLAEAERGVVGSPLKAALEAVREIRDILRDAIDHGGLTPDSLDRFYGRTVPLMNRAIVGPQQERHAELLALIDAGTVRVPLGAAPEIRWDEAAGRWSLSSTRLAVPHREQADWRCAGHTPSPAVDDSASPLIRSLYRRGRLRPVRPASEQVRGVALDARLHPVDAAGESDRRLWLIGPLNEGTTFYNHLIPTPGYSRAFVDAHRCVAELFTLLDA